MVPEIKYGMTNFFQKGPRESMEETVLKRLQATPPDMIVIFHKDTREYGTGFFGTDPTYGKKIMDWVNANYSTQKVIQHEPLVSKEFGAKVMVNIK